VTPVLLATPCESCPPPLFLGMRTHPSVQHPLCVDGETVPIKSSFFPKKKIPSGGIPPPPGGQWVGPLYCVTWRGQVCGHALERTFAHRDPRRKGRPFSRISKFTLFLHKLLPLRRYFPFLVGSRTISEKPAFFLIISFPPPSSWQFEAPSFTWIVSPIPRDE